MPQRDPPFSDDRDSDSDLWKAARMSGSGRFAPPKFSNYVGLGTTAIVLGAAIIGWVTYRQFIVDVPNEHIAILIKKEGLDLENSDEVAPDEEHRGVQSAVLTEGRYVRNPFYWDWKIVPQVVIKEGMMGIRVSLSGDDLPYGEFLARLDEKGQPITKGVVPGVLRPGRYQINPYLYQVAEAKPVTVPAGFVGIQTNLAGPFAKDPNRFLVPKGFRGVEAEPLQPGTYYVNPYEVRINIVDCRSQRFNLAAKNEDMGFPSKDGFWVSLDGIIEFRIKPEKAAEVFVVYNEHKNGDAMIDQEIIDKIIRPSALSFCRLNGSNESGRQFIQGETRTQFQDEFQKAMKASCDPLGVEIIQALITKIKPPQKIAKPVRDREIAKQQELQYRQQILREVSQQKLAIETEMVKQKEALVKADQQVIKLTTQATREMDVAITKSNQDLKVAQFKLEAAKDEAAATVSRGKAAAEVVHFQNEAEAAGWKQSVSAFGGEGAAFARYTLYKKMAVAYREIMVNTKDSPIMQIFQSFNAPGNAGQKAVAKPGAPEKIAPTSPVNPAPRAASLTRRETRTLGNADSPRPSVRSQGDQSHE
ncbi:MAG TPA: SPFH domain-containing protein [Planctomycetaceae bacterium]|jgi:regulator of protease activity HflC (stomatin/prohibitin superfamily)|nr:SPFH domain-containing protein [Planctomycetaceae bacterium]